MDLTQGQYFSIRKGELLYFGRPLPEPILNEAKDVLAKHVWPDHDKKSLYLSAFFCIASQRTRFEKAVEFTRAISDGSLDEITDPHYLAVMARKTRILHSNDPQWKERGSTNRFEEALDFMNDNGGIEAITSDLLNDPLAARRKLNDAKCNLAPKTASFWYLCLGGKDLMTLDTHNYRQIAGLGKIKVNPHFYNGKLRKTDGRMINTTPSIEGYEEIETKTLRALRKFAILNHDGKTDGALLTALFWVAGAKTTRYGSAAQMDLFDELKLDFKAPYKDTSPIHTF